jgi:hypothetical protein
MEFLAGGGPDEWYKTALSAFDSAEMLIDRTISDFSDSKVPA